MKNIFSMIAVASVMTSLSFGDIYTDPAGDIATGNANLDITQVEITDNGLELFVSMTVADLDGDWGKYLFFSNYTAGGSADNDNPWFRNVSGLSGTDYFMGSWLDGGGGASGFIHDGTGWAGFDSPGLSVDWSTSTITWNLTGMMLDAIASGATGFDFEMATTGGNSGDPAIDLLGGEGTQPGWGGGSTSTDWMHYEFSTIPAPGVLALFAIAGITRRRRH
ncbi:MAG: hypothetical protein HOC21_08265 [Phycisphaerae bacterium]|nr:hypothetical protein [Phycisphaerae bacterium]